MKFIFGLMILSSTIHGAALQGQSFMVSNLDGTNDLQSIRSFLWIATSFRTGSEESILQSMVTRLEGFDGGNEFVSIYNDHETEDRPGISYATFQDDYEDLGSNNRFQFTPNGTFTLSANTTYWMVFGGGRYSAYTTSSTTETGSEGWSIGNNVAISSASNPGNTWEYSDAVIMQFQITSIIPETSTYIFASGICLVAFATFRRRRIAKMQTFKRD